MLPALPLPKVVVDRVLLEMDIASLAARFIPPALPLPTAGCPVAKFTRPLVLLTALLFRNNEPTFALILPALASQAVEVSICARLTVNIGALIDTVPPVPGVKSVIDTKGLPNESLLALSWARTCMRSPGAGATRSSARSEA